MRRLAVLALLWGCAPKPTSVAPACPPASQHRADTIRVVLITSPGAGEAERLIAAQVCGAPIAFSWLPTADARDVLERGADAVLTDQPQALEYAAARGAFTSIALPWSRAYVLLVPLGGQMSVAAAGSWRDAVRGESRAPVGPFWWTEAQCGGAPANGAGSPKRVMYPEGDARARGLAERLVARGAPRAAELSRAELPAAVAAGTDYAVVPLPLAPGDACETLRGWGLAGRPGIGLIPLVETRFHLVVRRGRFGVSLNRDGTPRIDP